MQNFCLNARIQHERNYLEVACTEQGRCFYLEGLFTLGGLIQIWGGGGIFSVLRGTFFHANISVPGCVLNQCA